MRSMLYIFVVLVAIVGCGAPKAAQLPTGKPKWTLMPPHDGNIYGVGESAIHVSGLTYQRALAISRGIDEIARQKGVTVSNSFESVQQVSGTASSQAARNYSVQTVEGQTVKAMIKDVYEDPYTKRIYILMMEQ